MMKILRYESTYLVTGIASEASQCTLYSAGGRINVRLESGGLIVRHRE